MDKQDAIGLIDRYLAGAATKDERERFFHLLETDQEFVIQFDKILREQYDSGIFDTEPSEKLRQLIQAKLKAVIHQHESEGRIISVYQRRIFRWIAAAVLLFIVCGLWFVVQRKASRQQGIETTNTIAHDVPAPANTRAVITLADGRKVFLDSVNNGTIAQENNVSVVKNSQGEILYLSPAGGGGLNESPNNKRSGVDYNTIYNPRGSKVISLTLSDGTKVWLNSESSLKYPIAFNGDTREVEITGEAYFEVAHLESGNAKQAQRTQSIARRFNAGEKESQNTAGFSPMPFIVKKGDVSVTVLGTHFNVNAYDDEESLKVTLLEGSVRVSAKSEQRKANSLVIKPGEQAVFNANSYQLTANSSIDLDEVMAWKNGRFSFNRADIKSVMRQLARWYDLDVVYEGAPTGDLFGGDMQRDLPLSKTLDFLKESQVHFRVEGRKVVVMP